MVKILVGIDVGITHLGLFVVEVDDENEWKWKRVIHLERICLLGCYHRTILKKDCKLYHTKAMSDLVDHFHQEFKRFTDVADHILIERQPICGLVHIEQL